MNKTFKFSLIGTVLITLVISYNYGAPFIDAITVLAIGIIFIGCIPILIISGLFNDFFYVLSTSDQELKKMSLLELQNAHEALCLVIKTVLCFGVLLILISLFVILLNFQNLQLQSPNFFGSLFFLVHVLLTIFIFLPLTIKIKRLTLSEFRTKGQEKIIIEHQKQQQRSAKNNFRMRMFSCFFLITLPLVYFVIALKIEKYILVLSDLPYMFFPFLFSLSAFFMLFVLLEIIDDVENKKEMLDSRITALQKKRVTLDFYLQLFVLSCLIMTSMCFISLINNPEKYANFIKTVYLCLMPLFYMLSVLILFLPVRSSLKRMTNKMAAE